MSERVAFRCGVAVSLFLMLAAPRHALAQLHNKRVANLERAAAITRTRTANEHPCAQQMPAELKSVQMKYTSGWRCSLMIVAWNAVQNARTNRAFDGWKRQTIRCVAIGESQVPQIDLTPEGKRIDGATATWTVAFVVDSEPGAEATIDKRTGQVSPRFTVGEFFARPVQSCR